MSGPSSPQLCQRNTLLLCYGRVALGIKEEVLPRVELIVTRLIDCFLIDPSVLGTRSGFEPGNRFSRQTFLLTPKAMGKESLAGGGGPGPAQPGQARGS